MIRYQTKPIIIEALQYTDIPSGKRILAWTAGTNTRAFLADPVVGDGKHLGMTLRLVSATAWPPSHLVSVGDWVIRGPSGEHYPCKPHVFAATYDLADQRAPWTFCQNPSCNHGRETHNLDDACSECECRGFDAGQT
jgi:hypothetical protein